MSRAAKKIEETLDIAKEQVAIEDMPLETLRDYRLYNEKARTLNKKLKECRYPIKPCPVELHPKQTIVFRRNDQPNNPLDVYISNDIIEFKEKLIPGKTYELPEYVVHYLAEKGTPVWQWVDLPNGERETRVSHKKPRFSLHTVYSG